MRHSLTLLLGKFELHRDVAPAVGVLCILHKVQERALWRSASSSVVAIALLLWRLMVLALCGVFRLVER